MSAIPAIFVSHGAPNLPIYPSSARDFLEQLGQFLPTPKGILSISAHWETLTPAISTASSQKTIHDFYGFPEELYRLQYPVAGDSVLSDRLESLLKEQGYNAEIKEGRGLDHGVWVPLMLMYPHADIPTIQLSLQLRGEPHYHFGLGRALASLREEGILILASGSATHNLKELAGNSLDAKPLNWVTQFSDWLNDAVANNQWETLLNYRDRAPYALRNHPTEEHLLPLFVAMGAGGEGAIGKVLHSSFTYGVLSMAAFSISNE
ncbi:MULTISPECIES: class III extradiol ring-cleavage dioxygenase [Spirulina sp. CCY15215]|uniref:DODA-type extradiol aromatic ring-opening family dioxygenase n=1 Tax=Spirulina sp. CCY15215 TaxID=2767591 RepID=UPI0019519FA7|nr:class III extradiol ring-cleavage dioxygenase [Spirulina major]